MTIKAQAQINVTGPVVIFVTGDVSLGGGGIANTTQDPSNLQIFVTGTDASYTGNSDFYGLFFAYAPDSTTTQELKTLWAYAKKQERELMEEAEKNYLT